MLAHELIEVVDVPGAALGRVTHMWGPGDRSMLYNLAGTDIDWSPAHEFGHVLGLDDRNHPEVAGSSILGFLGDMIGAPTTEVPDSGYENNIMAITGGELESRNIADLLNEHWPLECVQSHLESPV